MNRINDKIMTLRNKMDSLDRCFDEIALTEIDKMCKDKLQQDRVHIIKLLMNYDETQFELMNDTLDLYNHFYDFMLLVKKYL